MDRLITASGYRGTVVVASDGVEPRTMDEDRRQTIDPHAWNSAANALVYVGNIVKALSAADPEHAGRCPLALRRSPCDNSMMGVFAFGLRNAGLPFT